MGLAHTSTSRGERRRPPIARPLFREVLCAIDGSQGSLIAAEQAIALSSRRTVLTFLSVYATPGRRSSCDRLAEANAEAALASALEKAARSEITCTGCLVPGTVPARAIAAFAGWHDLLVVGAHGETEVERAALGRTATTVAHWPERAVLIARRPRGYFEFPSEVLLASDGSPGSWGPAAVSGWVGGETGSTVRLVHVPDGEPTHELQARQQRELISAVTGSDADLLCKPGAVPGRICQAAVDSQASLVVVGRRGPGRAGLPESISEMVVHRAPCSVLVVPPISRLRGRRGELHGLDCGFSRMAV